MAIWRSVNLQCNCCGRTHIQGAVDAPNARRLAATTGWTTDETGKKDFCAACRLFACHGQH